MDIIIYERKMFCNSSKRFYEFYEGVGNISVFNLFMLVNFSNKQTHICMYTNMYILNQRNIILQFLENKI